MFKSRTNVSNRSSHTLRQSTAETCPWLSFVAQIAGFRLGKCVTHYETSYAVQTLTKLAAVPLDQNQLLTITCNQMKPHQTRNVITSFEEMHLKTLWSHLVFCSWHNCFFRQFRRCLLHLDRVARSWLSGTIGFMKRWFFLWFVLWAVRAKCVGNLCLGPPSIAHVSHKKKQNCKHHKHETQNNPVHYKIHSVDALSMFLAEVMAIRTRHIRLTKHCV